MKKALALMGAFLLLTGFGDPVYFNVKSGNELYEQGKYGEALEVYRNAQKGDPESRLVDFNLGSALYKLERYGEAAQAYTRAMTSDDDRLKTRAGYNRGSALLQLGDQATEAQKPDEAKTAYQEAVKQFKTTLKIDPTNEDARHNLEIALEKIHEMDQQEKEEKQDKQEQKEDKEKQGEGKPGDQGQKDKKEGEDKSQSAKNTEQGEPDKQENEDQEQTAKEEKGSPKEMTPEQARQIMSAIERDERNLREKLRAEQGEYRSEPGKDW